MPKIIYTVYYCVHGTTLCLSQLTCKILWYSSVYVKSRKPGVNMEMTRPVF